MARRAYPVFVNVSRTATKNTITNEATHYIHKRGNSEFVVIQESFLDALCKVCLSDDGITDQSWCYLRSYTRRLISSR